MKKRKRRMPGKFITQNRLPKEKPSLGEISKGQIEQDVRKVSEHGSGSPYWDWMEKHGAQTEDGTIIESPLANPDILAEGVVLSGGEEISPQRAYDMTRKAINTVLTEKQRHIMMLLIDGFSQDKIAHNLGISPESVSKHIKASRAKLEEYLQEYR